MPEPQRPKYNAPIKSYPTPSWGDAPVDGISVVDEYLREYVECNASGYIPLPPGSPHPNTAKFPNHRLLKEENVDEGTNLRHWVNGYRNQDQYNYDIAYSAEASSHPIFSRRYMVRRDQYVPFAKGDQFTGVYLIEVTDGGSGYNPQIPPTVTITGDGSGATAIAVVSNAGVIEWVYLTNEGQDYTATPTVSFSSGAATAVAKTQLATGVVYSISVTNGGSGYVSVPTVTITSATGSGATAVAQISGGDVVAVQVTAYGSGYVLASVSFSGGGGTGAAATATIQSVNPVLVKEDVQSFPEDDPRRSLYLLVSRQYESLPGPILIEHRFEAYINQYVSTLKSIVLKSTVPADMFYVSQAQGEITEYAPLSDVRYIKIVSKINPLMLWENGGEAADTEYLGTANYSFPNEIPTNPEIHVYYAYSGSRLVVDFQWRVNQEEGYSGPCSARFVRRMTLVPENAAFQAALPEVTYIKPEADVIQTGFVYVGENLIAQGTSFPIPSTLHPELEIQVFTNGLGGGAPVVTIDNVEATVPPTIADGTEILASISVTPWQYKFYIYTFVYITKPTPP